VLPRERNDLAQSAKLRKGQKLRVSAPRAVPGGHNLVTLYVALGGDSMTSGPHRQHTHEGSEAMKHRSALTETRRRTTHEDGKGGLTESETSRFVAR
jgi:hypothetical protein